MNQSACAELPRHPVEGDRVGACNLESAAVRWRIAALVFHARCRPIADLDGRPLFARTAASGVIGVAAGLDSDGLVPAVQGFSATGRTQPAGTPSLTHNRSMTPSRVFLPANSHRVKARPEAGVHGLNRGLPGDDVVSWKSTEPGRYRRRLVQRLLHHATPLSRRMQDVQ